VLQLFVGLIPIQKTGLSSFFLVLLLIKVTVKLLSYFLRKKFYISTLVKHFIFQ